MQKNKYEMIAGWETMAYLDKQSQEIAETLCEKQMLTSEASFKFKKQLCKETFFFENLNHKEELKLVLSQYEKIKNKTLIEISNNPC